jgi:hypothetical protein
MSNFVTRAYNRFEKNLTKNTLTKYSKEIRLKNESNYYAMLHGDLKVFFPRLIKHGFHEGTQEYFMEIEYYPYTNLSDVLFFKLNETMFDFDYGSIARTLRDILSEFKKHKPITTSVTDLEKIYVEKTVTEQAKLVNGFEFFNEFSKHDIVKINGIDYENFHVIWPKVIEKCSYLLTSNHYYQSSTIHGDMCFSNILFHPGSDFVFEPIIRFIDPRGEFGQHKVHGDLYYDLAKLHHSTNTGYELIIRDRFKVETPNTNEINFKFFEAEEKTKNKVHEVFSKELYSNYSREKIKLIEATIYVGMCARHYDSLNRQKVMYASGVKLLNEAYNEIINLPQDDDEYY